MATDVYILYIYIYTYIYTYIRHRACASACGFFFSVFPSAWFPTWCHLEPSWANLEARWANLELTWAKLRQHGAHLGPNNANNRSFKNVEKPLVFFVFLRSGSLQEGANLTNLHPSCATLSPHMAKVDKFEVVLIVFG